MARRTKEEAQETRHRLLDAAEHLFQEQGVSRTSLQDIARRAGATRGAVYWHFRDKADLFNAMMERVTLPLEESFNTAPVASTPSQPQADALRVIRQATQNALHQIATDPRTRRVLEVATHKVEYVEELQAVRIRHLAVRKNFLSRVAASMEMAASQAANPLYLPPTMAAKGLHALIDGLIQNWLLEPEAFDLEDVGRKTVNTYLNGLGLAEPAEPSPASTKAG